MTEKLLVTDANIFFDLLSVELFDVFFSLPCEIHTTDFVVSEIKIKKQKNKVSDKIKSRELFVKSFESDELTKIIDMSHERTSNVSIADISVWYYAKNISGTLLTGDAKLRSVAEKDTIIVRGILFVFDSLVENNIITKKQAAEKLKKLLTINPRLPHGECAKRVETWEK